MAALTGAFGACAGELVSVAIVEQDAAGDASLTWSYPAVDPELEPVLVARSQLGGGFDAPDNPVAPFVYSNFKGVWHYSFAVGAKAGLPDASHFSSVTAYAVCLVARAFNPEKYAHLARLLAAAYRAAADPTKVLAAYLRVFTTGGVPAGLVDAAAAAALPPLPAYLGPAPPEADPAGLSWAFDKWDDRKALIANASLLELVRLFGVEAVLLWNAVVLKKRILVRGASARDLPQVMRVVRSLPLLAWHRRDWGVARPCVVADGPTARAEVAGDLGKAGVYIAGFVDAGGVSALVAGPGGLPADGYDLLVDVPARALHVADAGPANCPEDLAMGKLHKGVAQAWLKAAEADGATEQAVIKAVALKTAGLVKKLKTVAGAGGKLTRAALRAEELGLNAGQQRFLYNLAMAEGLADGSSA